MITFDDKGFQINGQDGYLISGEFPYFRVPKSDWKRRMKLFLETGGNCIASYAPWLIHEPEDGRIVFDDCDCRDLRAFLETAKEVGLNVIIRPGPYVYSELTNAGLPSWLIEKHPQILALDIHGKPIRDYAVSYLHPVFLEKARRWYRAFAEEIKPYLASNGGPIAMVQVDNELSGIHLWSNSMDYNPETIGLGKEDGRYAAFLRGLYGSIESLNAAYGTDCTGFAQTEPVGQIDRSDKRACRRLRDYSAFYRQMMSEYLNTLVTWLREDGVTGAVCHNSGTPSMNGLFEETVRDFHEKGEGFLLGSDHYYNLDQSWSHNNPTPWYALRMMTSCDTLRALGMPPLAMELPGGSCSDTPPILANDMLTCYLTNIGVGLKGLNYYIFTGGPNVEGTGESCSIYDFGAPVAADGMVREDKFAALKAVGVFARTHAWMQRAERFASVQIGFEWNTLRSEGFDWSALPMGGKTADELRMRGLLYTLMCSRYSGESVLLTGKLDRSRPLIVPCPSAMSEEAQSAVADFVQSGGRVLLLPTLPETDLNYEPASSLAALLPGTEFAHGKKISAAIRVDGLDDLIYGMRAVTVCEKLPEGATAITWDSSGQILGFEMPCGKGKLLWFGCAWMMSTFPQAKMLEVLLAHMDAVPAVQSSNRNLLTTLWQDVQGHRTVFVMNLYSSPQSTDLCVLAGKAAGLGRIDLAPMEVKVIDC